MGSILKKVTTGAKKDNNPSTYMSWFLWPVEGRTGADRPAGPRVSKAATQHRLGDWPMGV